MYTIWIEMERYRLRCVESWPESAFRRATLAAIRYELDRLLRAAGQAPVSTYVSVCDAKASSPPLPVQAITSNWGTPQQGLAA